MDSFTQGFSNSQLVITFMLLWLNTVTKGVLRRKEFIWVYSFRGRVHHDEKTCQQGGEHERSHLQPQHETERDLAVGWGHDISEPAPSDVIPPGRLDFPMTSPISTTRCGPSVQIHKPVATTMAISPHRKKTDRFFFFLRKNTLLGLNCSRTFPGHELYSSQREGTNSPKKGLHPSPSRWASDFI